MMLYLLIACGISLNASKQSTPKDVKADLAKLGQNPPEPISSRLSQKSQNTEEVNSCIAACIQSRQMEARSIDTIRIDCEQSCNETAPELDTPVGGKVLQPQSYAELLAAVGKTVKIVGTPVNSKASPLLQVKTIGEVYCRTGGTHWPEETKNKSIEVLGEVVTFSGNIYPVATQDENGAWSQGVGGVDYGELSISEPQIKNDNVLIKMISYKILE